MRVATCLKLIVLGAFLIALGVGVRTARNLWQHYTSPEYLEATLRTELSRMLQAELELGPVRLNEEGLLSVRDLALRLPDEPEPVLACPEILVELDPLQMLRRRPVVVRATLVDPTLRLAYSPAGGRWNVQDLLAPAGREPDAPRDVPLPPGLLRGGIVLDNATIVVRHEQLFGDPAPRAYPGIYLQLRPARGLRSWTADGDLRAGCFGGMRLQGWARVADVPELSLQIAAAGLRADEAFWHQVPFGSGIWRQFAVRGLVDCQGTIRQRVGEEARFSIQAELAHAAVRVPYYPVELAELHGRVHVTQKKVQLQDCVGVIPAGQLDVSESDSPPPQVRVNGALPLAGGTGRIYAEVMDMPFGRETVTAIPEAGPEIWRRLAPEGRCRVQLTIEDRPAPAPDTFRAVVHLDDATVRPPELPVPVRRVGGSLVVDGRTARLAGVTGQIMQDAGPDSPSSFAAVGLDGVLDLRGDDTALRVTVRNLDSDQALVQAVPRVGADLWTTFRPEVVLDADLLLRGNVARQDVAATVLLALHGGTVHADFLPMPVHDVCGLLRVEDGAVLVEGLTAVLDTAERQDNGIAGRSMVRLCGRVRPESTAGDLYVEAANLRLNETILATVPEVGRRLWEEAQPQGTISVSGRVRHDPEQKAPLRFLLTVDLQDITALPRFLPVPIDALAGHLLLTEDQAISNDFSGVTCSGQFDGAAVVYYGQGVELPGYGAQLQFSQIELGELLGAITDGPADLTGRLSGALAIGGLAGDSLSTVGRGVVRLSQGRLFETPFFGQLLGVLRLSVGGAEQGTTRGEARFVLSGDTVHVHSLELTGGGLSLTGYGEVMLDGRLNLKMVAVGAPVKGGIPIVSPLVGWLLQFVERELVQLHVTGTIQQPRFEPTVLTTIKSGVLGLPGALLSPFQSGE